jgi:hypothetical protein
MKAGAASVPASARAAAAAALAALAAVAALAALAWAAWPHRSPFSIIVRTAFDRDMPRPAAHLSSALIIVAGRRIAISGSLPVAGRPLFLGITFIFDFRAMLRLYLNTLNEARDRCDSPVSTDKRDRRESGGCRGGRNPHRTTQTRGRCLEQVVK